MGQLPGWAIVHPGAGYIGTMDAAITALPLSLLPSRRDQHSNESTGVPPSFAVLGTFPPFLPHPNVDPHVHLPQLMSLTWSLSRPFTISTYDPPSTSVLIGQSSGQRLGGEPDSKNKSGHEGEQDEAAVDSVTRTPSARAKGRCETVDHR